MRHRVLDDESLDPFRMSESHPKAHRAAIVLHVKRVAREPERLDEMIHNVGVAIERIREFLRIRPVAVSKAWVIRSDKVTAIGEPSQERLEHA
jgi:hypothetical protein